MDIQKVEQISERLAEAVLNTEPSSKEFDKVVNAYNSWIQTVSEVERKEAEIRLKQNADADKVLDTRNEEIMKQKRYDLDKWLGIAGISVQTLTSLLLMGEMHRTVNAEIRNEPIQGLARRLTDSIPRILITTKPKV